MPSGNTQRQTKHVRLIQEGDVSQYSILTSGTDASSQTMRVTIPTISRHSQKTHSYFEQSVKAHASKCAQNTNFGRLNNDASRRRNNAMRRSDASLPIKPVVTAQDRDRLSQMLPTEVESLPTHLRSSNSVLTSVETQEFADFAQELANNIRSVTVTRQWNGAMSVRY